MSLTIGAGRQGLQKRSAKLGTRELRALLEALANIRRYFDPASRARKTALLNSIRRCPLTNLDLLKSYHEQLLFLAAYPDSPELLRAVNSELMRISSRVHDIYQHGRQEERDTLDDSGIANSHLYCSFSLDAVRWIMERFPGEVDLFWDEQGSAGGELDDFLKEDVLRVESDVVLHETVTTKEIFSLIGGGNPGRAIPWLLGRFERSENNPVVHDRAFEHVAIDTDWTLRSNGASRTWVRFPGKIKSFQTAPLTREVNLRAVVRQRIGRPVAISARRASELIDAARATLLCRHRETDPVIYAHQGDVELFALEDGVEVALFGARPERRRPLETYVGFVAAKNKVPVAYGGAWILGPAAEIGVNVFDSFRGGESALLFASIMRVYAQRYLVTSFFVDPYQFGKDNEEGIKSGAFWFYYRLGFRPVAPALERLAGKEWEKIASDSEYRSSPRVLRRLATAPVGIVVSGDESLLTKKIDTAAVSLAVCELLGKRYGGDRVRALRDAEARVRRELGIPRDKRFSAPIERAFAELSLIVSLIPGVARWSKGEKELLAKLLLHKGSRKELHYAHLVRKHKKFLSSLGDLAKRGEDIASRFAHRR